VHKQFLFVFVSRLKLTLKYIFKNWDFVNVFWNISHSLRKEFLFFPLLVKGINFSFLFSNLPIYRKPLDYLFEEIKWFPLKILPTICTPSLLYTTGLKPLCFFLCFFTSPYPFFWTNYSSHSSTSNYYSSHSSTSNSHSSSNYHRCSIKIQKLLIFAGPNNI
jgi:hypothetical protein